MTSPAFTLIFYKKKKHHTQFSSQFNRYWGSPINKITVLAHQGMQQWENTVPALKGLAICPWGEGKEYHNIRAIGKAWAEWPGSEEWEATASSRGVRKGLMEGGGTRDGPWRMSMQVLTTWRYSIDWEESKWCHVLGSGSMCRETKLRVGSSLEGQNAIYKAYGEFGNQERPPKVSKGNFRNMRLVEVSRVHWEVGTC